MCSHRIQVRGCPDCDRWVADQCRLVSIVAKATEHMDQDQLEDYARRTLIRYPDQLTEDDWRGIESACFPPCEP